MLTLQQYKVYEEQSLYDVAIVCYGDANMAIRLAAYNGIGLTDKLVAGTDLKLIEAATKPQVLQVYKNTGVIPATEYITEDTQGGIGFMQIGTNFKIAP